jgi:hypothetical protein
VNIIVTPGAEWLCYILTLEALLWYPAHRQTNVLKPSWLKMNCYGYPPTNKHTRASYIAFYNCYVKLTEQFYSFGNLIGNLLFSPTSGRLWLLIEQWRTSVDACVHSVMKGVQNFRFSGSHVPQTCWNNSLIIGARVHFNFLLMVKIVTQFVS